MSSALRRIARAPRQVAGCSLFERPRAQSTLVPSARVAREAVSERQESQLVDEEAWPVDVDRRIDPKKALVIVFPGQGDEFIGMTKKALQVREVRELWERAHAQIGYDLLKLCLEGPAAALKDDMKHAQAATFMGSMVALTLHRMRHPEDFEHCIGAAGLSIGEYAAFVAAGVISFEEGLRVVDIHGRSAARECVSPPGGMLVVFTHPSHPHIELAIAAARLHCWLEHRIVAYIEVANYLAHSVKVISGHIEALKFIQEHHESFGIKNTKIISVRGGFHTPLLCAAAKDMTDALAVCDARRQRFPVHCSVNGMPYRCRSDLLSRLGNQIWCPLQWEVVTDVLYAAYASAELRDALLAGRNFDRLDPHGTNMRALLRTKPAHPLPRTVELGAGRAMGALLRNNHPEAFKRYSSVDM